MTNDLDLWGGDIETTVVRTFNKALMQAKKYINENSNICVSLFYIPNSGDISVNKKVFSNLNIIVESYK